MMTRILAILIICSTAAATKIDSDTIQESLNKMDKGSLTGDARVLRNYNSQNYQYSYSSFSEIDVDSSLLIEFEECTSLTILNDQVMAGMEKGNIFEASKDFIIFSARNHNKHAKKKFAVDIATFVSSMAETILTENYNFCQACAQARFYCGYRYYSSNNIYSSSEHDDSDSSQQNPYRQPENDGSQQSDYTVQQRYDMYRYYSNGGGQRYSDTGSQSYKSYRQQYGNYNMNGGNRNLQQGRTTETIDCETCQSVCAEQSGTYVENSNDYDNNQGEYTNYEAIQWLRGLSECERVNYGNYYNTNGQSGSNSNQKQSYNQIYSELYASLMCNADGTGIEIGLFMDEECSVWNPSKSFKSIMEEGTLPYFYYTKSKNLVEFIFTKQIGCGETEYVLPDENEGYSGSNYNSFDYSKYGNTQAHVGCQYLFEGNVLDIGGSCTDTEGNDSSAGQNDNAEESAYTYFSSSGWSTYHYDITDQDSDDQLCSAIQKQMENGATHTTNTQPKKDNLYTYNTSSTTSKKLTGGDVFLIFFGVALVIALVHSFRKKYIGQWRTKKVRLIDPRQNAS